MNNLSKIKLFIKTARPSGLIWSFQLITYLLIFVLGIYSAYPSANAITAITMGNLNSTIFWLVASAIVVFLQQFLSWVADRLYYANMNRVWQNVHGQIYDKISHATNASFVTTSKEKIINIAYSNIGTIGDFPNDSAKYISYFVQAVTSIIILLTYNFIIGIAIVVVCVLIFFVQNFLNRKIEHQSDLYYSCQDKALEVMTDTYHNRNISKDFNIEETLNKKYLTYVSNGQKAKRRYGRLYSITDNWVPFAYKVILCLLSIYLVILTKSNILTLTLYLVLTNYLTQSVSKMTDSYVILDKLDSTNVATLRVKNVLEMDQEDMQEFGKNTGDNIQGEVLFTNASYVPKTEDFTGEIKKFSLKLSKNSATLIYGAHKCGKRAIFYMLNRSVRPTTGTITIDNINIYDFDKETYKHNVAIATSKNYLYNDTIMKNLQLSGASKTQIYEVCKRIGIHDSIVSTQLSYHTNLSKTPNALTSFEIYLLGIARALCTNAEVICLYELPQGLTIEQRSRIKSLIRYISKNHTVLVFAYNDFLSDICANVYNVTKGVITQTKRKSVNLTKKEE